MALGADVVPDNPVYTEAALAGLHFEGVAALNPKESTASRLVGKEMLGKCVQRFRFALQTPHHALGFPTGNHVIVKAKPNGKLVMRAYTPIVSPDQKGFFDLLVKIYVRGQNPEFPMGGVMSQYMDNLQVGDTMDMRGPLGKIHYVGRGVFECIWLAEASLLYQHGSRWDRYQIIRAIGSYSQDKTQVSLIYANHREEDILLRDQLDKWQRSRENVKIWYTITHPPRSWRYSVGRLTESMMREHLFPPGPATVALLCGPPAMCERCCNPKLLNMGYNDDSCFIF